MKCTNRVGKGGELDDMFEMVLSEEEIVDDSDTDNEDDPTVSQKLLLYHKPPFKHNLGFWKLRISIIITYTFLAKSVNNLEHVN